VLTLETESSHELRKEKEGRVICQECRDGKFMRSFNLGADVIESDIRANFEGGVLTLEAPKAVLQEPQRHRIEVQ